MPAPTHDRLCREIVDHAGDAIVLADRDGMVRLWNARAEAMFGYRADEAIGRPLDLIIPDRLRDRHWAGYRTTMATGTTRYGDGAVLAVPAVRKDGSALSIEFTIALLRGSEGEPLGALAVIRDVTERWERDRELRKRLAALEAAVKQG
jgi:PAS domain S-box-containing protein